MKNFMMNFTKRNKIKELINLNKLFNRDLFKIEFKLEITRKIEIFLIELKTLKIKTVITKMCR